MARGACLPLRLALTNERRFLANIDQGELCGLEEARAAQDNASHSNKPQHNTERRQQMEPQRSLEGSNTGSEQCDESRRGKRGKRHINRMQRPQEQGCLLFDAIYLLDQASRIFPGLCAGFRLGE